jgi:hypothetical protein
MATLGGKVLVEEPEPYNASTDMGNVCHKVPGFHGATARDTAIHSVEFATAASTLEAHAEALKSGKGMAMMALQVLHDTPLQERFSKTLRKDMNS